MRKIYHGWLIELTDELTGYSFQCLDPRKDIAISDRQVYPTLWQALQAAQKRADLEAVSLALVSFLNEISGRCYYLQSDDRIALTHSIAEFVQLAVDTPFI
jgi:hypothetical protein